MAPKEKDPAEVNFNAYVGSETGFLKGVCFGDSAPVLKELTDYKQEEKLAPIRTLCWADVQNQKDLLVGLQNRRVKVYNTKLRSYTQEVVLELENAESPLVALGVHQENYLVGQECGNLSLWDVTGGKVSEMIRTGDHLACLRTCPSNPSILVTGGKENDVKIWDLAAPSAPTFKAKNVPHVYELRVPVWVQDATFLPQTTDIVAAATRYGHLRLYDAKVDNKNRPVINMEFCDHPLMSIASTRNDRQVLVGSSQGKVGLVDLRNYRKEKLVHLFDGFNGSVRCIVADENTPYFVSCSLDRYLYLHNLNEKNPVKKLYLKSRLTNVAITKDFLKELNTGSELESSWNNIEGTVLPGSDGDGIPVKRTTIDTSKETKRIKIARKE